jgi:hypothetical protein
MQCQLLQRLEGKFRIHLVPDDTAVAVCGATSAAGWLIPTDAHNAAQATCPQCQAQLTAVPGLIINTPPGHYTLSDASVPNDLPVPAPSNKAVRTNIPAPKARTDR